MWSPSLPCARPMTTARGACVPSSTSQHIGTLAKAAWKRRLAALLRWRSNCGVLLTLGLTTVDRHQTPASIKGQGVFRKRGQRAQGRPHDGLEYAHAGGGASLAQVAVRNLHAGQLSHVGRQCADAAQNVKDQTLHQLRTAQLGSLAARFGTVLAPELYQKRRRQQTLETLYKGADRSNQITCARLHPQCNGVLRSKVQVLSDFN